MFSEFLAKIFGTKHERDIKKMTGLVEMINSLEAKMKDLSNEELQAKTAYFREQLKKGLTLDDVLPEAFAAVREVSVRTLGLRHFDVQLMGGMVLHQGIIAEMKTGEGKTLTSTLNCYLNALEGKGVHCVTVNDYLAARDANWMRPIYDFLGISVGVIQHDMNHRERQEAYACDITYGTNNEFGFDYLRDNMVTESEHRVQRKHNYAIVDEVDSILIDEARTPLIISGPTDENTDLYYKVNLIIPALKGRIKNEDPKKDKLDIAEGRLDMTNIHFELDEKAKNAYLTEAGVAKVEQLLRVDNLYGPNNVELVHHVQQALKACRVFQRDVDYVVEGGQVVIVDEHTGRKMVGRRYSDGLHQALEAKESVRIENENQTLATITFQNFFRLYSKLAGMTGTADTEAEEFHKIYDLEVVVIPTNMPMIRDDTPDRVYRTEKEKFNAILNDIKEKYLEGQPVLVGTITIEKSEELSRLLKQASIPHSVLNAKFHLKEAEIIEQAGKPKAVTIATNMAGRGTDIVLGGTPEYLRELEDLESENESNGNFQQALKDFILKIRSKNMNEAGKYIESVKGDKWKSICKDIVTRGNIWLDNHNLVVNAGGLYVLGSERHESRRIDNQLRGRSGRQGDPGLTRFYLSFEDPLMRIFGSDRISGLMEKLGMSDGQEIEHRMVSRAIERAQKRVESYNFDHRKYLLEYDDVMNKQREYIYTERNRLLDGEDIQEQIDSFMEIELERIIEAFCPGYSVSNWFLEDITDEIFETFNIKFSINKEDFKEQKDPQLALFQSLNKIVQQEYKMKSTSIPAEDWKYIERMVILEVIDARWKDHLYQMDQLREGIWTVSYSQKQPLLEYKLQGFRLFDELKDRVFSEIVKYLFHVQPVQVEKTVDDYKEVGETQKSEIGQFGNVGNPQQGIAGLAPSGEKKSKKDSSKSAGGSSTRKSSRRKKRRRKR